AGGYQGPVHLRVWAGHAPGYDQTLLGDHSFSPGSFHETAALAGTTSLPVGTWYSFTSAELLPLIPAGTTALRMMLSVPGHGVYGWAKIDNVMLVVGDAGVPLVTASGTPAGGTAPL